MEKVLTISVACYNLKHLVDSMILSVINSKHKDDIELLLINDGGKQDSLDILKNWESKYPNTIKVITKENGGPGSTINEGIKQATGKYFKVVDGDDWVDTDNLSDFVEFLQSVDSDMIISNYSFFHEAKKMIIKTFSFDLPIKSVNKFDSFSSLIPNQMHAICYKTSIIKEAKIRIDNCFYTDVEYVLLPIKAVKTFAYFDKTIYVYRVGQEEQSVNYKNMIKNRSQHELVLNRLLNEYNQEYSSLSEGQRDYFKKRLVSMTDIELGILLTMPTSSAVKKEIIEFLNRLKKTNFDVYKDLTKSKKCKILIYSHFLLYKMLAKAFLRKVKREM